MNDTTSITAEEKLQAALAELKTQPLPAEAWLLLAAAESAAQELSQELETARQQTAAAHQERLKFVSVVTHELRLPLTSIKGYTDLLRQGIVGPVNDQQKNFLNVVRSNVERMTALISDLSDMSHLQSGRLKLQTQKTSLKTVVDQVLTVYQPRFDEKSQTFSQTGTDETIQIEVDPNRLAQVLGTFLNNANRYTPAGGQISLTVTAAGPELRFEIADSGIGISPADQLKIFSPFFRSEDEAVREFPGWGLALHVASLLVVNMGGRVGFSQHTGPGQRLLVQPASRLK